MPDDLADVRERVAIAGRRIGPLALLCETYLHETLRIRLESKWTGLAEQTLTLWGKLASPVPISIRDETSVIVHSLRASLDNLACVLAARNGHELSTTTYFPISKDETVFEDDGRRKMSKLHKDNRVKISSLRPYGGGNVDFLLLHKLDLLGKHQKLGTQLAQQDYMMIGGMKFGSGMRFVNSTLGETKVSSFETKHPMKGMISSDEETILAQSIGNMPSVSPVIDLVFSEPEEAHNDPMLPTLTRLHALVSGVVEQFY